MGCDILKQAFGMPSIDKAIADFTADWESAFGERNTIFSMCESE